MKRKVTVTIRTDVFEKFNKTVSALGFRRDAYLNSIIPDELDQLDAFIPSSESGEKLQRETRRFIHKKFSKVNLTFDVEVAEKLAVVCNEKRIPRDIFIEEFMCFLVNGPENGSCTAPLAMISELLGNPRFEYAPGPDENTPYDWLSVPSDVEIPDYQKALKLLDAAHRKGVKK